MDNWLKKQWFEVRSKGDAIGGFFIMMGFLLLITIFFTTLFDLLDSKVQISYLGVVLGLLSVGLGCVALNMGTKSDDQMRALVKIEFDSRWTSLTNLLKDQGLSRPVEIEGAIRTRHREFLGHLKVMKTLAKWAEPEMLGELRQLLDKILNDSSLPKGGVYDAWRDEVKNLRKVI